MVLNRKHPMLAFREAHALSQSRAAELAGIDQTTWSLLESGKGYASPAVAQRIAELTGMDRNLLLKWDSDNDSSRGNTDVLPEPVTKPNV